MIGNFSFEEHDRYFTRMYNHLRFIDRTLDITTIINIIKCKVILEQELENTMHNLNIKNIHDTPMVKDFKIWSAKYEVQSEEEEDSEEDSEAQSNEVQSEEESETQSEEEEESEAQSEAQSEEEEDSEEESEAQSETQSEEEEDKYINIEFQSEDEYIDDIYHLYGIDEVRRSYGNSEAQRATQRAAQRAAQSAVERHNYIPNISNIPDDY